MYAARQGAVDAVRALVAARADPDLTDPEGTTALMLAINNAHYDVATLLAEHADPNVADVTGMTALYAAVNMNSLGDLPGRPAPKPTGRMSAIDVARTLLTHGANPNARLTEADPAAPALGRRRRARRRGHAVSPRREDRRCGDDAVAARARRRPGADDRRPDDGRDVRGRTGVRRTRRIVPGVGRRQDRGDSVRHRARRRHQCRGRQRPDRAAHRGRPVERAHRRGAGRARREG